MLFQNLLNSIDLHSGPLQKEEIALIIAKHFYEKCFLSAVNRTSSIDEVRDVTQEVMLKFCSSVTAACYQALLNEGQDMDRWLWTIIKQRMSNWSKQKNKLQLSSSGDYMAQLEKLSLATTNPSISALDLSILLSSRNLTPTELQIIEFRIEGFSYKEICSKLDIRPVPSIASVKMRFHRAIKKLRDIFGQ